jgi:CRP-like cAMP-binding protein
MSEALLARMGRWAQLSAAETALLAGLEGRTVAVERGDDLRALQGPQKESILLLDSWAAKEKLASSGKRLIVELLLPGDLLMQPDPADNDRLDLIALSSGSIMLVRPDVMAKLLGNDTIGRGLQWMSAVRCSIAREWLANIGAHKARERLAHLLCELAVRLNAVEKFEQGVCEMPLTQTDLAAALAMTNVHLNAALQQLRQAGIVELRDKTLAILDRAKLEEIAEFDDRYLLQWPTMLPDRRKRAGNYQGGDRRRADDMRF